MASVRGGLSERTCRIVGGTVGAVIGGPMSYFGGSGAHAVLAGLAGGTNMVSNYSEKRTGVAMAKIGLDSAMAYASANRRWVGAVGGVYTYGKLGANVAAARCGY